MITAAITSIAFFIVGVMMLANLEEAMSVSRPWWQPFTFGSIGIASLSTSLWILVRAGML